MTTGPATRHLGLDLGATNLKWAVVEHAGGTWSTLAQGQVPTRLVADPDAVPAAVMAQLARWRRPSIADWGPVASVGVGVPGLYDPATGRIRFLPNVPGPWAGHPVGGRRRGRRGRARVRSSTTPGRSGSPSCAWGPGGARPRWSA